MSILKKLCILAFIQITLVGVCYCCDDKSMNQSAFLDSNKTVFIQWIANETHLTMKVTGKTKGWLGIGFSPTGRIKGADMVIGWVNNGTPYLQDRHGTSDDKIPLLDKHQDYILKFGNENRTHTIYCFERKLDTCDKDDYKITEGTIRVIYAYSDDDPENEDNDGPKYHGNNRRTSNLNIVGRMFKKPTGPDVKYVDFRLPNITIPSGRDTFYWCQVFELPSDVRTKHHLIGYEPLFNTGPEEFMHHLAVIQCVGNNIRNALKNKSGYECVTSTSSGPFSQCQKISLVWTKGGTETFYPEHVGFPFTNEIDGQAVFYLLNVHLDNPEKKNDTRIDSGLRVYYTSKLRRYDSGMLSLESTIHDPYLMVPPGQKEFIIPAHCAKECLAATLPKEGIKIYSYSLHVHLTGRGLTIRHYRNGTELKPIANNQHYGFNYQNYLMMDEEKTILPGDSLTLECFYNTENRITTTTGGESTRSEMCAAFLLYYSNTSLHFCGSGINHTAVNDLIGIKETYPVKDPSQPILIKEPSNLSNTSFLDYIETFQWNNDLVTKLQEIMLNSNQIPECILDTSSIYTEGLTVVPYPNATKYKEDSCAAE